MYLIIKNQKSEFIYFQLLFLSLTLVGLFFYTVIQKINYITISTDKIISKVITNKEKQINIILTHHVNKVEEVAKHVKMKQIKPTLDKKVKIKKNYIKKSKKILKRTIRTTAVKPVIKQPIKASREELIELPKKTSVVFNEKTKIAFIDELYEMLDKNKKYPRMAKRRHLEGICCVGFTLCKDGTIKDIVLTRSSGHKILDKAALKLIESLKSYKPIPETVSKVSLNLEIPIKYKRG